MKKTFAIVASLILLAGLFAISRYSYLLFHTLAETFSIVIAGGMFMVAWNARRYLDDDYLLVLGIAYLFIGFWDLTHTVGFKGMNLLPGYDAKTATQLWVATRYLESVTLLAAPLALKRRLRPAVYFAGYGALTVAMALAILYWRIFPDCYLENQGGLTTFKIVSEYTISAILLAAGVLLIRLRRAFDPSVLRWLLLSILLTILSEMAFTFYIEAYDFSNLIGHYFKIVSFYLIYRAIIVTGLARPYDLLFRELQISRESYRSLFANMINGFAVHRMVLDDSGKAVDYIFLEVNDAFKRMTGLGDVTGRRVTEVIPGIRNEPADWIGIYGQVAATGRSICFEAPQEALGKWYAVSAYSPVRGQFAAVFMDITENKRAEIALRASEARFKLLSDTAGRLLAAQDPPGIISDLCQPVMAFLECQIFYNCIVDDAAGLLRLNAHDGLTDEQAQALACLDYTSSISGRVACDRRRVIYEDIANASDPATGHIKALGFQAYACYPLVAQRENLGTLAFASRTRPRFAPDAIELMQTVADQVALALQRIQARRALEKANAQLEDKVRERTVELSRTVATLRDEIAHRAQVEADLRQANQLAGRRADQLRALTEELARTERRERLRLSKILHDGLQQNLAAMKMQLGCLAEQLERAGFPSVIKAILGIIDESIETTRSLSADLFPVVLYELGLPEALAWLAGRMQHTQHLRVDLELDEVPSLPEETRVTIFECVRELLFNVIKHAGVSCATVELKAIEDSGLRVTVRDQGCGFDPSRAAAPGGKTGGLGLFLLRERIGLIGGLLDIDSAIDEGARVTLFVPCIWTDDQGEEPLIPPAREETGAAAAAPLDNQPACGPRTSQ